MNEKEWAPAGVFDIFGDRLCRKILVLASAQPVSADDLAEQLDVSKPTVYRRVNALHEHDLLSQQQQFDIDGNHYQQFETTLEQVVFEIDDGGYNIQLQMRQSLADQFESFWSDLDEGKPETTRATDLGTDHDSSESKSDHV